MTRYILLRDKAGNWRRPDTPLAGVIAPTDPSAPADPQIEVADLTPLGLRDAAADPGLLAIQRSMAVRLIAPEPMDELRATDTVPGWGLRATGADRASAGGAGVRVALLDTGIDADHPAFAGVKVVSHDFAGTGIADANGHGTHIAATVLGRDLGGTRIGVARGVSNLLIGKVLTDSGQGRSEGFLRGVLWALREQADIIGFALAFDVPTQIAALKNQGYPAPLATFGAIDIYRGNLRIWELLLQMIGGGRSPLLLGAVGNDCLRTIAPEFETGPSAPAAATGVLAVGACGPTDGGPTNEGLKNGHLSPAPFTNTGADLAAPGVGILSAGLEGGLRTLNGSSMAMAHAAGIAALWAEQMRKNNEPTTARALARKLVSTATAAPLSPGASFIDCGRGVVQAPQAQPK